MSSCERKRRQAASFAFFDPTILCTTYDYELFPLGLSLEEVSAKLQDLNTEERLAYILRYSGLYHERRHFHDIIGTTYGLKIFYYSQKILNQFLIECLPYLEHLRRAQVPLVQWANTNGCPNEILRFIYTYRRLVSEVSWLTALMELPATYSSETKLSAYKPNSMQPVPVIRIEDVSPHYLLGGFALEEGAAFVIENLTIRKWFGSDNEEIYNSQTMASPHWKDYVGALSFFFDMTHSRNLDLFLGACDYALNIDSRGDFRARHPGWRFALVCEQLGWKNTSSSADAMRLASERLQKNAGWSSAQSVWEEAVDYCRRQIHHNQDFYSRTESLIGFVNLKYYSLAKTVFEKRLANTINCESFWDYGVSWTEFPKPPLSRSRIDGKLKIKFERDKFEDAALWVVWAFLWQTVRNLVEGDGLVCLQHDSHGYSTNCFQHPYCSNMPWRSGCEYGVYLQKLGLDSIDWVAA